HHFFENRFLSNNYFLYLADNLLACPTRIVYLQPFQAPIRSIASRIKFSLASPPSGVGPYSMRYRVSSSRSSGPSLGSDKIRRRVSFSSPAPTATLVLKG